MKSTTILGLERGAFFVLLASTIFIFLVYLSAVFVFGGCVIPYMKTHCPAFLDWQGLF